MKRRLLIIAICLLLGAVVNVAVAWASVWWAILPTPNYPASPSPGVRSVSAASPSGDNYDFLRVGRQNRPCAVRVWSSWFKKDLMRGSFIFDPRIDPSSIVPNWARSALPDDMYLDWDVHKRVVEARGWPMLALWSGFVECKKLGQMVGDPPVTASFEKRIRAIPLPSLPGHVIVLSFAGATMPPTTQIQQLPLRPMWPGFSINTFFYAAILWLLISGPFALRRFLRLRRGLCPKCAYPMGESSVCTECGGALPSVPLP